MEKKIYKMSMGRSWLVMRRRVKMMRVEASDTVTSDLVGLQ